MKSSSSNLRYYGTPTELGADNDNFRPKRREFSGILPTIGTENATENAQISHASAEPGSSYRWTKEWILIGLENNEPLWWTMRSPFLKLLRRPREKGPLKNFAFWGDFFVVKTLPHAFWRPLASLKDFLDGGSSISGSWGGCCSWRMSLEFVSVNTWHLKNVLDPIGYRRSGHPFVRGNNA